MNPPLPRERGSSAPWFAIQWTTSLEKWIYWRALCKGMKGSPCLQDAICNTTQLLMRSIKKLEQVETKTLVARDEKKGWEDWGGQSAGFSCSFALLVLSLTWIKCCCSGCEGAHIPAERHSSEGKFLSLTLKITGAPTVRKNLWHVWFYTWHRSTEIFSKTAAIKFNSLENAYFFWRHVRLTFLES